MVGHLPDRAEVVGVVVVRVAHRLLAAAGGAALVAVEFPADEFAVGQIPPGHEIVFGERGQLFVQLENGLAAVAGVEGEGVLLAFRQGAIETLGAAFFTCRKSDCMAHYPTCCMEFVKR